MKHIKLIILAALGACFGAPPGFRTANAEEPDVQKQLADQAREIETLKEQLAQSSANAEAIEDLRRQLELAQAAPLDEPSPTLVLLCRGAGVDIADVRWRIAAGLDEGQAVEAALAQKASDASRKATQKKGGK